MMAAPPKYEAHVLIPSTLVLVTCLDRPEKVCDDLDAADAYILQQLDDDWDRMRDDARDYGRPE